MAVDITQVDNTTISLPPLDNNSSAQQLHHNGQLTNTTTAYTETHDVIDDAQHVTTSSDCASEEFGMNGAGKNMATTDNEHSMEKCATNGGGNEKGDRRVSARVHLVHSLRDRAVKSPLKWSRWVSEVKIPNYRTECRNLGDPLLFKRAQRLPTALNKREEFLMDTPLATFSYHVERAPRKHRLDEPLLGREVTLSELHTLLQKSPHHPRHSPIRDQLRPPETGSEPYPTSGYWNTRSSSTEMIQSLDSSYGSSGGGAGGFNISIQQCKNRDPSPSMRNSLPQITLTIRQAPSTTGSHRLQAPNSRVFRSPSWDPSCTRHWRSVASKYEEVDDEEGASKQPSHTAHSLPAVDSKARLQALREQPKLDRTHEWLYESPLDTKPPTEESAIMKHFRAQKPSRKVRFGGGDWLFRHKEYMFE